MYDEKPATWTTNCNFTQKVGKKVKNNKQGSANLALDIQKKVQIKYEKGCEKYNIPHNCIHSYLNKIRFLKEPLS